MKSERNLTTHHLVPRNVLRARKDLIGRPGNLVMLCRRCHDFVEAKEQTGGHVHRARLRASLTQLEVSYVRDVAGEDWLDWRYPLAPEAQRPQPRIGRMLA
jgi:5-methylcytosine-specific restriction endonuclease McrA